MTTTTPQTNTELPPDLLYRFEDPTGETGCIETTEEVPAFLETEKLPGFWARKFSGEYTAGRKVWDVIFSIILPTICFIFDPIVFQERMFSMHLGGGMLGKYAAFSYSLAVVTMLSAALYHTFGHRLRAFNPAFAGLFAAAGIVSLVIGIIILPYALLGSVFLIGILGFTPLFSAFTMFRMSYRAMHDSEPFIERTPAINLLFLSGLTAIILPYLLNVEIGKLMFR